MLRIRHLWLILCPTFLLLFHSGCKKEIVPKAFYPRSEHEAYLHSLEQANLSRTALGRDWIKMAEQALQTPYDVSLPFEEVFYWDPKGAEAAGYHFFVKRGVRIEVEISVHSTDSLLLFADLFRERGDSVFTWVHVATADKEEHRLEFEPRRDAYYILRLQPELLRGGKFRVLIREVPSMKFPVWGKNSQSIHSFFGDPRDAGSRKHHGVDIFASRHTPVVAPVNSRVTGIDEGKIGGRYIWLYDSKRSMYLYFAHLETQDVQPGDEVVAGQAIGTVGNSGNAKYTLPHLHFGIYRNGPVDPYHFIAETDTVPARIQGDSIFLGKHVWSSQITILKSSPVLYDQVQDTLEEHLIMKVTAMTAGMYRVLLPDGSSGYIPENKVELIRDTSHPEHLPGSIAHLETSNGNRMRITKY